MDQYTIRTSTDVRAALSSAPHTSAIATEIPLGQLLLAQHCISQQQLDDMLVLQNGVDGQSRDYSRLGERL